MNTMTDPTLVQSCLNAGAWEIVLYSPGGSPDVEVWLGDRQLSRLSLTQEAPGHWRGQVAVPPDLLSDGVHVVVLRSVPEGTVLGHLHLSAGTTRDADLAAEVALLRAELEMVKTALRRMSAKVDQDD